MSEVEPAVAQAVEKRDCGKAKVEHWNVKREAPIGTTWTLRIKDDWTPTPKNINALPEPLRAYIHDLKTVCDPAGDVTELFRLQTKNRMLRWECERRAKKAGEWPRRGEATERELREDHLGPVENQDST